jgi:plastocyanin
MRRLAIIAALLGALVPVPAPADPYGCALGVCPSVQADIRNVFITPSSGFTPEHVEDVRWATDRLSFVNLDAAPHTATDLRCLDADLDTSCAFDIRLSPVATDGARQWQGGGTVVVIRHGEFEPGQTYAYRCTFHPAMTGAFTVV